MEEKKVIKLEYLAETKVYNINWDYISGMNFFATDFWEDSLVLCSRELSKEQLAEYANFLSDIIDAAAANGKDAWDDAYDDSNGSSAYTFETSEIIIRLVH